MRSSCTERQLSQTVKAIATVFEKLKVSSEQHKSLKHRKLYAVQDTEINPLSYCNASQLHEIYK
jgi:hypothetical protein